MNLYTFTHQHTEVRKWGMYKVKSWKLLLIFSLSLPDSFPLLSSLISGQC